MWFIQSFIDKRLRPLFFMSLISYRTDYIIKSHLLDYFIVLWFVKDYPFNCRFGVSVREVFDKLHPVGAWPTPKHDSKHLVSMGSHSTMDGSVLSGLLIRSFMTGDFKKKDIQPQSRHPLSVRWFVELGVYSNLFISCKIFHLGIYIVV